MYSGNIVERLENLHPTGQHGNIRDETDIAHELVAVPPGIAAEYPEFALIGSKPEDCIQGSRLACAIGSDEP
jgi:hypothetical protein